MVYKVDYNQGNGSRIPADLQAVFTASNQGQEVNKPPCSAFKVFKGIFGRKANKAAKKTEQSPMVKSIEVPKQVVTPQEYLDKELSVRGYSVQRYTTINSGYSNMPTPL